MPGLQDAHSCGVSAVAWVMYEGISLLATAGSDGIIRLWELGSGRRVEELAGHDGSVIRIAWARIDGSMILVSVGKDDAVRLWDPGSKWRRSLTFRGVTALSAYDSFIAIAQKSGVALVRISETIKLMQE